MIKLEYKGKNYNYKNAGSQPYDIVCTIDMIEDSTATEVILALMELLKTATYRVDTRTLLKAAEDYAWENNEEEYLNK